MTMKVGIEGRVITGPAGGPGTVDVPLRIAVVQEGVNPKTIVSKFGQEQVAVSNAVDRVTFTHVDSDISFPLPVPIAALDSYIVYIGFDPLGAQPPKVKHKPKKRVRPAAKPKPGAPPRAKLSAANQCPENFIIDKKTPRANIDYSRDDKRDDFVRVE